jgi:hypothetical protein
MNAALLRTPYVLLTRHFLRQFLENDLISPEADRTQLLAVVGALVISMTLFISAFMTSIYIGAFLTPGEAAIRSLDDKYFYLALAMIVTALVAASQWDVLAIDSRDAAILEPLPVPAGTIRRAKVTAVAILGAAVAVAVNGFPSWVFPWMLSVNFPRMRVGQLFTLMEAHAVFTVMAGMFGYLVIIALRESMVALLGRRLFAIASPWAQGALIVWLGSSLLMLPAAADQIGENGFGGWRASSPPMWFLGVYESAIGGIVADLPRGEMTERKAAEDRKTSALYATRRAEFPALARRAVAAFGGVLFVGVVAYAWNARNLPSLAALPPPSLRRRSRAGDWVTRAILARDRTVRAGFDFTLAAMWRSNTHRLTLVSAAAAGFALAVLALSNADAGQAAGPSSRLLAMQPLLYGALLVGFRHIIRVPAELRANWGFQLAWRGRENAFVSGVRRAAILALVLPALAILFPLFVFVLGPGHAVAHALLGLAGAMVLLEALMASYDKVPFTCTYLPSENMKALAPVYAIVFIAGATWFAQMQNTALRTGNPARILVTLTVLFVFFRIMSLNRMRVANIDFDEAPATFQGLGLHRN